MTITLYGDPRTKKNSLRIVRTGKYSKVLPSKAYTQYEADCLRQMLFDPARLINTPVNVRCLYFMKTRRKVDLGNLQAATLDILVKGLVLADDNSNVVKAMDGSRVFTDKDNPRVEIEITPFEG